MYNGGLLPGMNHFLALPKKCTTRCRENRQSLVTSKKNCIWKPTRFSRRTMIFSHEDFRKPDLPIPQRVIAPAINALSEKNRDLPDGLINQKLAEHSIALDKPILIQVSRFDKWKDPIGVIRVFEKVKARFDCQLILLGALADDDPEGQ